MDWDLVPTDQLAAKSASDYYQVPLLATDILFFNTAKAPFNSVVVRNAFADAINKSSYAKTAMQGSVQAAESLFPPAMSGYQSIGATYNATKAASLLKSAYPNLAKMPPVTFTYPVSTISPTVASALQSMWEQALGIQVNLLPLDQATYEQQMNNHNIQLGFTTWSANMNDPYDFASRLLSTSSQNVGQWNNPSYDALVAQAEATTGEARVQLFQQAEQMALSDMAVIPLDYPETSAIIPAWVEGVSVNGEGLYFGDWSQVKILNHKV
jgi:oligopeptide transport system substrate-binding protein